MPSGSKNGAKRVEDDAFGAWAAVGAAPDAPPGGAEVPGADPLGPGAMRPVVPQPAASRTATESGTAQRGQRRSGHALIPPGQDAFAPLVVLVVVPVVPLVADVLLVVPVVVPEFFDLVPDVAGVVDEVVDGLVAAPQPATSPETSSNGANHATVRVRGPRWRIWIPSLTRCGSTGMPVLPLVAR